MSLKMKENANKILEEKEASILKGLVLGATEDIDEEINENFKITNISHILAISGMHITYIILGIEMIFKKAIGKRKTYIITIIILLLYMFITSFSPSVVRSSIMGILMVFSKLIYRKNDIWTSISLSLLIMLIYNPFLILNIGLQLSYFRNDRYNCFSKKCIYIF